MLNPGRPTHPQNGFSAINQQQDVFKAFTWLAWHDHMAVKYERYLPDHLQWLGECGARHWAELNRKT